MQEEFLQELAQRSYEFYSQMAELCKQYTGGKKSKGTSGKDFPLSSATKGERKKKTKVKDPNRPKQPMSAYLSAYKKKFPNLSISQISLLLSTEWNRMSNEKKQPYVDEQNKLKKKYKTEIEKYNAKDQAEPVAEKKTKSEKKEKPAKVQSSDSEESGGESEPQVVQKKTTPKKQVKQILGSSEDSDDGMIDSEEAKKILAKK